MKKILTPLLIFIIIAACDDSPSGPDTYTLDNYKILKDQTHNVIMPLTEGNFWGYKNDVKGAADWVTSYMMIFKDSADQNFRIFSDVDPFCYRYQPQNTNIGLVCKYKEITLFFKYPIDVWDKYEVCTDSNAYFSVYYGNDSIIKGYGALIINEYTLLSKNEIVETEVGTFDTYLYQMILYKKLPDGFIPETQFWRRYLIYLAPDFGLVKLSIQTKNERTNKYEDQTKLILKEYTLN